MDALDIKPNQQVRYIGKDKFGFDNDHTGQIFTIVTRHWDDGSHMYLFNIRNEWGEERINVPADVLEEVE